MPTGEDDRQDADVPELAVKALTSAHRRALEAGRTLVLVRNDWLIRIHSDGTVQMFRQLPARKKVVNRTKVVRR
jgi:hypothetical protein